MRDFPHPRPLPEPLRRVRDHLEANFAATISLDELARLASLSKFHVNRLFREAFGLPPHAYQIHVRILRAQQMLARGLPIAAVAERTGFASPTHLHRHFRRITGITPGQFQQLRKNG